jgi:hypothetical protein
MYLKAGKDTEDPSQAYVRGGLANRNSGAFAFAAESARAPMFMEPQQQVRFRNNANEQGLWLYSSACVEIWAAIDGGKLV